MLKTAKGGKTTTIQARIEVDLKERAEQILASIGLTVSDGMRLFLRQTINSNGLPFQPTAKRPNVEEELARLKRIIKYDQDFEAMRNGKYTEG